MQCVFYYSRRKMSAHQQRLWSDFRRPWDTALTISGYNLYHENFATTKWAFLRIVGFCYMIHFCVSCLKFCHDQNWDRYQSSEACMVLFVASIIAIDMTVIWCNRDKFVEIATYVDSNWEKTKNNQQERQILKDRAKEAKITMNLFSSAVFCAAFFFTILSLVQREQLILPQNFPAIGLDGLNGSAYYWCNFIYHEIAISYVFTVMIPFHNIYVHLILQLIAQMDILGMRIQNVKDLKEWYLSHVELLSHVKTASSAFKYSILAQFSNSTCAIAIAMFMSSTNFNILDKVPWFLLASSIHLFIFCWYGEMLSFASIKIGSSACHSDWLSFDTKERRNFLLILQRAQRPTRLSLHGQLDAGVSAFVLVMKNAYSWHAVLSTTDEDDL